MDEKKVIYFWHSLASFSYARASIFLISLLNEIHQEENCENDSMPTFVGRQQ
jgi:hypothetical protein